MAQRSWFTVPRAIVAGVVVFFAVATPLAIQADSRLDRIKPMYNGRAEMMWLQYQNVVASGGAVAGVATAQAPVQVGGVEFTPADGVIVEVRAEQREAPCVRASNDVGDVTNWACVDLDSPPVDPDAEPVDPVTGEGASTEDVEHWLGTTRGDPRWLLA